MIIINLRKVTMSTKLLIAASAAALSLSACSTMMGDPAAMSQGGMTADMTPERAMPYVAMAGSSDLYEIQSSQLHHQRGQNQQLHAFASMMIDHHTRTTQATMAAAQGAGMSPPPPMLMPMHRDMIARLQGLNGAAFDREYARQQRVAHEMALALHQNYARAGDTPSLRTSAASAVPVVQGHLTQLRGIRM
jgi:putative membrane protein